MTTNFEQVIVEALCKFGGMQVNVGTQRIASDISAALRAANMLREPAVPDAAPSEDDREALIREAIKRVREIGEAGKAGEFVHRLPKDADANWGWLQKMWPVVVAVDSVLSRDAVPDADGVDAVLNRLDELNNYGISYEVYSELHDLVSAIPTAVPDAATEVLDAHRCDESAERAYKRTIRAEAERDAALAAIERVRVLHEFDEGYCKSCEIPFHECDIATALVAALDGAPEPEVKP